MFLSPGIPEYLSGSSPVAALVTNPGQFAFQIVANLGLYGPGVLLVREATIRWRKGWATILLLGVAYGILEEGVALSTLFNPSAGPVGALGNFGHWLGVSWVWAEGVVLVHVLYSISLPILLLRLAVPETGGKSLLGRRGIAGALLFLGFDVLLLTLLVAFWQHFWMGLPLLLSSFFAVGLLIYLARHAPAKWPKLREGKKGGTRTALVIGALVFPVVLVSQGLGASAGLPAWGVFTFVLAELGLFFRWVVRNLSFQGNERHLLTFAIGLVVPIAVFGFISQFPIELVLIADLALALLFANLFRMYLPVGNTQEETSQGVLRSLPELKRARGMMIRKVGRGGGRWSCRVQRVINP